MPQLETVKWVKRGKIAQLVLMRPHVLNAVNNQATRDLIRATHEIGKHTDVRVVIVRGAGRAFSTGIDLKQLSTNRIGMAYYARWERVLRSFETMEKVVIAAIKQYCLGGGLQLALACDIRIASRNAIFGLPAVKEGLIPGLAPWRLPRYIGLGRARRYILSGDNISADEALAIGLVDYVQPTENFDSRVMAMAQYYVKVCSVAAVQSKLLINQSLNFGYERFRRSYLRRQRIARSSRDHYEAKSAYLERRQPVFA